jgi:hypothetical protein
MTPNTTESTIHSVLPADDPTTPVNLPESKEPRSSAARIRQLIAAARGVRPVPNADVAAIAKELGLGPSNSKRHRMLSQWSRYGSSLVPWFRPDVVTSHSSRDVLLPPTSMQMRQAVPQEDPATGKLTRAVMLQAGPCAADVHPATPASWLTESDMLVVDDVEVADGVLAQLLAGCDLSEEGFEAELSTTASARTRLTAMMETVDPDRRVCILSLSGAWEISEMWAAISLSHRNVLLALPEDPEVDWATWSRTRTTMEFFQSRNARVTFAPRTALGIDDPALHVEPDSVPSWVGAFDGLPDALGEAPDKDRNSYPPGTWLVSDDGTQVEVREQAKDLSGVASGRLQWTMKTPFGGRVVALHTHRVPTDGEIRTGRLGTDVDPDVMVRSTCEIEVRWVAADGTLTSALITGPATLLMYDPKEWHKQGAHIPSSVLLHPSWPPKDGRQWAEAVKTNTRVPAQLSIAWETMGWVPTPGSPVCSFISGSSVLSLTPEGRDAVLPGVTDLVLPGAHKFALPATKAPGSPEWESQAREDLRRLRTQYLDASPWSNPALGAVVIAAGLRPVVPIKNSAVLYVQGPPGAGKSWTASHILSFHQARRTWTEKSLPGSMKDTSTSVEQALARTNIWVMDDLSPSVSRRQNEIEQARAGDLIRSAFNGAPKRRSGPTLAAQETFVPKAVLIVTAENPHDVRSVRERGLIVGVDSSTLVSSNVAPMNTFRDESSVPGRLTAATVGAFQLLAAEIGWDSLRTAIGPIHDSYRELSRRVLGRKDPNGSGLPRAVEVCVDIMMGLAALHVLATRVNDEEMLTLLDVDNPDGLPAMVAAVAADSYLRESEAAPGADALAALRNLCAAGKAHIIQGNDPSEPPGKDAASLRALGWQSDADGNPRPLGECIGCLRGTSVNAPRDVVFVNKANAFKLVQNTFRSVAPHGTTDLRFFGPLWDESLIHPYYLAQGRKGGKVDSAYSGGRGVAIHLDRFLGIEDGSDDSDGDSPD